MIIVSAVLSLRGFEYFFKIIVFQLVLVFDFKKKSKCERELNLLGESRLYIIKYFL